MSTKSARFGLDRNRCLTPFSRPAGHAAPFVERIPSATRANLERFIGYSLDQGLMEKKLDIEELFAESTLGS